jgi:site-specific recombinase XerD
MNTEKSYEAYLRDQNLSANTIRAYLQGIRQFDSLYPALSRQNLRTYKIYLIEHYTPQTVNLRIRAVNCYLTYLGKERWHLSTVKVQQKPFLENVISEADYLYFKNCLKNDHEMYWYFVIRFMAATGARVSELTQIKVEHVNAGYLDLYSKGGKLRRIYIPQNLRQETVDWLDEIGRQSGFLFVNKQGSRITARGISWNLKHLGSRYGLDPSVIYPHSFRHRFAKNFLERCNDLALLADLMGHENIETTRIYLRKTSTEQQQLIDRIVDW